MPSSSPIPSICAIEIEAVLFPFHDDLLQVFIPRMYYNYRIENRANEEPAAILFTSATRKDGLPPPPVRLSWDSRHPPPESVRTDGRMDVR